MIFALISALAWSLFDLARKQLTAYCQPLPLSIWLAAGVIPLYALLWLAGGADRPQPAYWFPALVSLVTAAIASVSFIKALSVGRIAMLIPLLSFTPVVAALLSWLLLGEALTLVQGIAVAVIVGAIFVLHGGWKLLADPSHAGAGAGLMLLVALCWGTGIVFDKWALASATVYFHGMIQSLGMVSLLYPAWLLTDGRHGQASWLPRFSGRPLSMLLALAVFALAVSSQWQALVSVHPGVVETVKRGVGILGAALWGVWFFGEQVKRWQLALMLVIIAATAGLTLS